MPRYFTPLSPLTHRAKDCTEQIFALEAELHAVLEHGDNKDEDPVVSGLRRRVTELEVRLESALLAAQKAETATKAAVMAEAPQQTVRAGPGAVKTGASDGQLLQEVRIDELQLVFADSGFSCRS